MRVWAPSTESAISHGISPVPRSMPGRSVARSHARSAARSAGGFDERDFFGREAVEFIDELVDLLLTRESGAYSCQPHPAVKELSGEDDLTGADEQLH